MDKPPLSKMDSHQAAVFALRLYVPALRRYVDTNFGPTYFLQNRLDRTMELVHEFFTKPGNAIAMAVYKATPYYHNPIMLWSLLKAR